MIKAIAMVAALALTVPAAPVFAASSVSAYQAGCANVLNYIPRIVRKQTVRAVGPDARVTLHGVCVGVDLFDFGNAGGLGKTIWANPTLHAALARRGLHADDVVGISVRGTSVDLYIHRQ